MKRFILATMISAATLGANAGYADSTMTSPKANTNPDMPAVVTDETPAAVQPAAGSNSFTETQAKERLMQGGYSKISALKEDGNGIWRGTARMKNTTQKVAVDYQGNITTAK